MGRDWDFDCVVAAAFGPMVTLYWLLDIGYWDLKWVLSPVHLNATRCDFYSAGAACGHYVHIRLPSYWDC